MIRADFGHNCAAPFPQGTEGRFPKASRLLTTLAGCDAGGVERTVRGPSWIELTWAS